MKRNFNKLFSEFYDEPDVDSAWDSMRKMLDEQMPVERRDRSRRSIIYYTSAAAMLLLLLGALVVGKTFYANNRNEIPAKGNRTGFAAGKRIVIKSSPGHLRENNEEAVDGDGDIATNLPTIMNKPVKKIKVDGVMLQGRKTYRHVAASRLRTSLSSVHIQPVVDDGSSSFVKGEDELLILPPAKPLAHMNAIVSETKGLPVLRPLPLRKILATNFDPATVADAKERRLKKFGFNVGLYHNVGGANRGIYPMVAVTTPLSKKFYVSLGVAFNSQVHINNFAPKEFTVINDTTNQVYFTVVQKHISKAVYMDLPLAIYYKVNNRISMNAGMQLSFLQRTDINAEEKTFDFQSDLSQQISTRINTSTSSYTPNQRYTQDYTFLKTNGRFIAGIGYELKRVGIRFQYAKSFSPNYIVRDFDGSVTEKKLSSFTVGVNYRIR